MVIKAIRVLIVCDHPMTCIGLSTLLSKAEDIQVVAETSSGANVLDQISTLQPEIILLDYHLNSLSGENLVEEIKIKGLSSRIIVLSPIVDEVHLRLMLMAGARGYILKTEEPEAILSALRSVANGELVISAKLSGIVASWGKQDKTQPVELSNREKDVLRYMALGLNNTQIAAELGITEGTVKNHVVNIYSKTGVQTRVEAVLWAIHYRMVKIS